MTVKEIYSRGYHVEHWTPDFTDLTRWYPGPCNLHGWFKYPKDELWVYSPRFHAITDYDMPCHEEVANIQSVKGAFPNGEGDLYITATDGPDERLLFRYSKLHDVEHLLRVADEYRVIDYDLACRIRQEWEDDAYINLLSRIEELTGKSIDPQAFNDVLSEQGIEPRVEGTRAFFVDAPTLFDIEEMIRRSHDHQQGAK